MAYDEDQIARLFRPGNLISSHWIRAPSVGIGVSFAQEDVLEITNENPSCFFLPKADLNPIGLSSFAREGWKRD